MYTPIICCARTGLILMIFYSATSASMCKMVICCVNVQINERKMSCQSSSGYTLIVQCVHKES